MTEILTVRDTLMQLVETQPRPDLEALLLAARFPPLRPLERIRLLTHAPTVADLVAMDHFAVERVIGRTLRRTQWAPTRLLERVRHDVQWLRGEDHHVWWVGDPEVPNHLRSRYDPPAVLFGWGDAQRLRDVGIALVGTRRPDDDGRNAAYRLGLELGQAGVVVVSGLALGIDSSAHRGAVMSGTPATAVLGSGIDTVYPRVNRALAGDLLDAGGLIVSEYPPGTPPGRHQFPARNRIVVGLAAGLVVIQAPEPSGALISAEFGLQASIEVMCHQVGAAWTGCKRLIQDGSPVIRTAADVLALVPMVSSNRVVHPIRATGDPAVELEERKLTMFDPGPEVPA